MESINSDVRQPDNPPVLYMYNKMCGDAGVPSYLSFDMRMGIPYVFIKTLQNKWDKCWQNLYVRETDTHPTCHVYHRPNYLLKVEFRSVYTHTDSFAYNTTIQQWIALGIAKPINDMFVHICGIKLFLPSVDEHRDTKFEAELIATVQGQIQEYDRKQSITQSANVSMLMQDKFAGPCFREFNITKSVPPFNKELSDLIYGDGFFDFSCTLTEKLNELKKGLILFHGDPGTGKTHYIRQLIKQLSGINKRVIYIPPQMVEMMLNPTLLTFLTEDILAEEKDTILLIEDAEPLLECRDNGVSRTTGISNLLNSTDGILNDILGLIVIATFNTKLDKIDKALLRPGRLIARKQFNKVPKENTEKILKKLNIENENLLFSNEYTISEIINNSTAQNILKHGCNDSPTKQNIGFNKK